MTEQTEPEDTCRPVEIDGETIRVRGAAEMNDESREAVGALIRVAEEKFAAEHPPAKVTDPERRERYAAALYATLEVSPTRHPWETLSPLRRAVWYARADAAMKLADEELQRERERLFVPLHRAEADNARLRAATPAGPAPATDQTALRDRIAEAIGRTDLLWWSKERRYEAANAAMAVLPAPDQRAAVLLEAADVGENVANRIHASGDDHRAGGAYDVVDELRRLAGEAQQDETQAQPPHHRWSVETRDAVADQWAPGTPITDRDKAVERYEHVTKNWPTWKDGTPVQRRLVRATTTYTVEQGAVARSGQPETDGETDRA